MPAMSHINMVRHLKGDAAVAKEILRAIVRTRGNKREASRELGIGKSGLYRLIEELNLAKQIDELCEARGFQLRAGRGRGKVDEETAEAIREGRRKALEAEKKAG